MTSFVISVLRTVVSIIRSNMDRRSVRHQERSDDGVWWCAADSKMKTKRNKNTVLEIIDKTR